MNRLRASLFTLFLVVGVAPVSACLVTTDSGTGGGAGGGAGGGTPPPATSGTASMTWSINGAVDPSACTARRANEIRVVVTRSDGAAAGSFAASCSAFATSFTLAAGAYSASIRLVDGGGAALTTDATLTFTIAGGGTTPLSAAFPDSSFLGPAPSPTGTVQFQWSMNGEFSPSGCSARSVTSIRVALVSPSGTSFGTFTQTCPAVDGTLSGSIPNVPEGNWTANATLFRGGTAATTTAAKSLTVAGGSTVTLDFEFPDSSFF